MKVRPAVPQDAPAIAEIHVEAWRAAYVDLMPASYLGALSVAERTRFWETTLSAPGPRSFLVLVHQDRIAAFSVHCPAPDDGLGGPAGGELVAINVHPAFRAQGLGRCLCEHIQDDARRRRWPSLHLWVLSGNTRARAFYERLGFAADRAERVQSWLIGAPLHELRYVARIADSLPPAG